MLRRAERLTDVAEQVVTHMPKSKAMRDAVRRVDRDKARVDFVKRYSDLYGMYTETEVVYTDDRTLALFESLVDRGQGEVPLRRRDDRLEVLPAGRALAGRHPVAARALRRRDRERPTVTIREREEPVLALFDMEGTIITSNVVESYVWARMADLTPEEWPRELASVFGRIPGYLQVDRRDRGDFLRTFFRRYEGASVEGIDRLVASHVAEFMLQKASAAAIRRIREHRAAGHRTILITAAAEPFVRPLSPLFDRRDRRRARAARRPLHRVHVGAAARRARRARRGSVATRCSRASTCGTPTPTRTPTPTCRCCERSGNPVAVSPDSSLYRYARRRRWPIEEWGMTKGMPRVRFPRPAVRT